LLLTWRRALLDAGVNDPQVAGLKPVETGVTRGDRAGDGATLEQLSTFHVKRFPAPYLLPRPVSPHLAARDEGLTLQLSVIVQHVADVRRAGPHGIVLELAGGLFSPLAPGLTNVDVIRDVGADEVLLVAPDRLGVLHDVAATTRAAAAAGAHLTGLILVAPEVTDTSTGTNAAELALVTELPVIAVVPRADMSVLAARTDIGSIVAPWVTGRGRPAPPPPPG
jgi:dethiobiotin synthetase